MHKLDKSYIMHKLISSIASINLTNKLNEIQRDILIE